MHSWSRWPPTAVARSWRTFPAAKANGAELGAAARVVRDTESQIKRRLDTSDLPELLYNNLEHASLGRRRRALPVVYELHDGLPDVFLPLDR